MVLKVTEIIDCTAEATWLMMLALCSAGFFCSSSIFIPVQRHILFSNRSICSLRTGPMSCSDTLYGQGRARASKWFMSLNDGLHCVACLSPYSLLWSSTLSKQVLGLGNGDGYQVLSRAGTTVIRSQYHYLP